MFVLIPKGLDESPETIFEFPFNMIGNSTKDFLTGQSRNILKSWFTGRDPEQGFRLCFEEIGLVF